MRLIYTAVIIILLVFLSAGCGDSTTQSQTDSDTIIPSDADIHTDTDTHIADIEVTDNAAADKDSAVTDKEQQNDDDNSLNYGFSIRTPQNHTLTCKTDMGDIQQDYRDADHLCSFSYNGVKGYIYIMASVKGCLPYSYSPLPDYETVAQISIDGKVSALEKAAYDFGGNHHNDWFTFTYSGTNYKYYHSSFGYGWRSCQPMDCLQTLDDMSQLKDDGCTAERKIPVICVLINDDGTYPALVDTFAKCPGDSNPL